MTAYDGLISAGNVALEPEVLGGIFSSASEQSVVLGLGRKLRNMTTNEMKLKVSTALPEVYFVGEKGKSQTFPADASKKVTTSEWQDVSIKAGELAAIIVIPNTVFQDANFDIIGEVRAQFPAAIAAKVDSAILYGSNATDVPDDWSDGIFTGSPVGQIVDDGEGADLYDAIFDASGLFAKVEQYGYDVNGIVADVSMKAQLRALRDVTSGMPLFLNSMQQAGQFTLGGINVKFPLNGAFDKNQTLMIAGDWSKLVYSIRQDVAIDVFTTGVIDDGKGSIVHNLLQEDLTALRCTFRMAWGLPLPAQRYTASADMYPFAFICSAYGE
jgi:HK97 family phage major capsid protein